MVVPHIRHGPGSRQGGRFKSSLRAKEPTSEQALLLEAVENSKHDRLEPASLGCKWHGHDWDSRIYMYDDFDPPSSKKESKFWLRCKKCNGIVPCGEFPKDTIVEPSPMDPWEEVSGYVKRVRTVNESTRTFTWLDT